MNSNKINRFLEIVYNCPLLLLVMITSLILIPLTDEIKLFETNEVITVSRLIDEGVQRSEKGDNGLNHIVKADEAKVDSEQAVAVQKENNEKKDEDYLENAGICKEESDNIKSEEVQNKSIDILKNAVKSTKETHGITNFLEYNPIRIDSRYYSDAGKVALTTDYDYEMENESYFNDAAFLGDSRTLGISDYAGLDGADFFCDNGMTIYKLLEDDGVTYQKTGEKVDMKEILQEKRYGKIYIMLGMNELGYGNTSMYLKQYLKVIRQIKEWQPGVIIYIMGNLHVSREKNNMETEFNNININDKNVASARLANGRDVFYLDCNPLFTDEEGYLQADLTFDGVHLYAQHYDKWRDFLFAHGVEREDGETMTATMQGGDGHGGDAAE